MSIFDSISRTVKNVFVGSHKGEDINLDVLQDDLLPSKNTRTVGIATNRYHPDPNYSPAPVGNINGFTFDNPLDSMPIATDNPRPEEEIADWFTDKEEEKMKEQGPKTLHQHMYEIATSRNNPFHVGGSENAQSEVDYIKKHSPWPGGSENFQVRSEKKT